MRVILSIAASALMLAGCADVYDKTAEAPTCKRLAAADHAIRPMSSAGLVMSGGFVIPSRDLGGSGKLDMEWVNLPGCIRQENNERNSPKLYDLHKIGMAI